MKINTKKAVIATMAIAMAAGIAGSISGTVAWFQYNTRVTTEFTGTTAKCTEFLQVRTVNNATADGKADDIASLPAASATYSGKTYISDDGKVSYCNGKEWVSKAALDGSIFGITEGSATTYYKWATGGSGWTTTTEAADLYGEWDTTLTNNEILIASGHVDNGLSPVTLPSTSSTAVTASGTLYGQPVCGYEQYAAGTYKWQAAETWDYMGFTLQFRVLDIDGTSTPSSGDPAMLAQSLYMTDLTVAPKTGTGKEDISGAVRLLVESFGLLAQGASDSAANITTTTHGALDLDLDGDVDNTLDVPGSNYNFNTTSPTDLDYGQDKQHQVAYNSAYKGTTSASNGFYPINDGYGHLSGGKALGNTIANTSGGTATYLSVNFKLFLEGWHVLSKTNGSDTDTAGHVKLWDSDKYIGSEFNVGMSFGVTTLD